MTYAAVHLAARFVQAGSLGDNAEHPTSRCQKICAVLACACVEYHGFRAVTHQLSVAAQSLDSVAAANLARIAFGSQDDTNANSRQPVGRAQRQLPGGRVEQPGHDILAETR